MKAEEKPCGSFFRSLFCIEQNRKYGKSSSNGDFDIVVLFFFFSFRWSVRKMCVSGGRGVEGTITKLKYGEERRTHLGLLFRLMRSNVANEHAQICL
jgi:hypothetical protein